MRHAANRAAKAGFVRYTISLVRNEALHPFGRQACRDSTISTVLVA
jgi:hypothetical protein